MASERISAEVRGLDLLNLEAAVRTAAQQGVDELHVDIGDGRFAPDFGVTPSIIAGIKQVSTLPCQVHLMVAEPEKVLPLVLGCGADGITLHVESCIHAHRALGLIRDHGLRAGLAVLPATPLTQVGYLLPQVDRVLLLGREPGSRAGGLSRAALERVRILSENIRYHEYTITLEVEGAQSAEDAARCLRFGAGGLVCSATAIPGLGQSDQPEAVAGFRDRVRAELHTV